MTSIFSPRQARLKMNKSPHRSSLDNDEQTNRGRYPLIDMLSRDVDRIRVNPDTRLSSGVAGQVADEDDEPMSFSSAEKDIVFHSASPPPPSLPFKLQRLPFNAAVAPLLNRPTAPFESSEREKALTSAKFYTECFLQGVRPAQADQAASEIQQRFNKWWGNFGSTCQENSPVDYQLKTNVLSKEQQCQNSHKRKRTLSSFPQDRKRRLGRGRMRDIIEDNTFDPYFGEKPSRPEEDVVALRLRTASAGVVRGTSEDESGGNEDIDSRLMAPVETTELSFIGDLTADQVIALRDEVLEAMKLNGGDTDSGSFRSMISVLHSYYVTSRPRADHVPSLHDGVWLSLSKPTYPECLGRNELGQYIYSLGRMSFDMFRPASLVCSIQGTFNSVHLVDPDTDDVPLAIPGRLRREVLSNFSRGSGCGDSLRTHNVIAAFTIEPNHRDVHRPIRGIMTNYGYSLPDPEVPDRLSIWFTGGSLEVNDEEQDLKDWSEIFDQKTLPKRDLQEFARVLAAKILLGAHVSGSVESDGTMTYSLSRPIGGHGSAFCDTLYMDESVRIIRGHQGSVYVFQRVSPWGYLGDLGRSTGGRHRVFAPKSA